MGSHLWHLENFHHLKEKGPGNIGDHSCRFGQIQMGVAALLSHHATRAIAACKTEAHHELPGIAPVPEFGNHNLVICWTIFVYFENVFAERLWKVTVFCRHDGAPSPSTAARRLTLSARLVAGGALRRSLGLLIGSRRWGWRSREWVGLTGGATLFR
jgi:hypothetical protein